MNININTIHKKLDLYRMSFYEEKKKDLMNASSLNKYYKTIDSHSYPLDAIRITCSGLVFVLSLFLSISLFNMIIDMHSELHLILTCTTSVVLTFSFLICFKKIYYKILFNTIKKDNQKIEEFLVLEHKDELNSSIISEEIHDLLKLLLSNQEYIKLRKNVLTYANVKEIVGIKQDEENVHAFLEDKYSVNLDTKNIKR